MFDTKVVLVDSYGVHHAIEGVFTFDGYNELHQTMFPHLPLTDHEGISKLFSEESRPHILVLDA